MMNEFGNPINDAELSMLPPGANKPHEKFLAESGLEMNWGWVIPVAAAVLGGTRKDPGIEASNDNARIQHASAMDDWQYIWGDLKRDDEGNIVYDQIPQTDKDGKPLLDDEGNQVYANGAPQLLNQGSYGREIDFTVKQNQRQRDRLEKIQQFRAKQNIRDYQFNEAIRDYTHSVNTAAYELNEHKISQQLGANRYAAAAASRKEQERFNEQKTARRFSTQEIAIESIQAEGQARVKGQAGRSKMKQIQAEIAKTGRGIEILDQESTAAMREHSHNLDTIALEKYSADLGAYAQRMIKPGKEPIPSMQRLAPLPLIVDPFDQRGGYDKRAHLPPLPRMGAISSSRGGWSGALNAGLNAASFANSMDWL